MESLLWDPLATLSALYTVVTVRTTYSFVGRVAHVLSKIVNHTVKWLESRHLNARLTIWADMCNAPIVQSHFSILLKCGNYEPTPLVGIVGHQRLKHRVQFSISSRRTCSPDVATCVCLASLMTSVYTIGIHEANPTAPDTHAHTAGTSRHKRSIS